MIKKRRQPGSGNVAVIAFSLSNDGLSRSVAAMASTAGTWHNRGVIKERRQPGVGEVTRIALRLRNNVLCRLVIGVAHVAGTRLNP